MTFKFVSSISITCAGIIIFKNIKSKNKYWKIRKMMIQYVPKKFEYIFKILTTYIRKRLLFESYELLKILNWKL